MNRKSTSSIGSHGRAAKTDALLGFSVWITPFRGATRAEFAAWQRRLEDYPFATKVVMREGLAEALQVATSDILDLFNSSVVPAREPKLTLQDFAHLSKDLVILRGYLDVATRTRKTGVNVLVHGRSGTGKTELVRALAREAGVRLLEVATEDPDGTVRLGKRRFDSLRFAQSLLAGESEAVLLFDDVEDVFCDGQDLGQWHGNTSGVKGWVNQVLERNAVPTFWVTNQLAAIDPAYRRRFDFVLHVDIPPRSARQRLIDKQGTLRTVDKQPHRSDCQPGSALR